MPAEKSNTSCSREAVAELFTLQLKPTALHSFLEAGDIVHAFFSRLSGYQGMDIILLSESKLMVLVRWSDYKLFDEHLPKILSADPVNNWLQDVVALHHQPAIIKKLIHHATP